MSADLLDIDDSIDSGMLSHLTREQKVRLTSLLDEYLQNLEKGSAQDVEQLLVGNADLREVFGQYIDKLNAIYGLANQHQQSRTDDSDQPLPFRRLGDFEIVREIGRGGAGVVYEAKQLTLGRSVALKLLSLSSALDPRQIARFHNESRAAGLLQHPNIVPVYSVGVQQDIHYYAMQLIDGVSIDVWIEQQRSKCSQRRENTTSTIDPVKWQTVVNWGVELAQALHVAHEAGVVHRDIKPSNLLLDTTGRIWIADFGLARCVQDKSMTASGVLVGTMRYMSPEQASGQSALVDAATDIYGLAASIYEMLVLHPAIEGEDAPTILSRIAQCAVEPLRAARSDLPRDLATVIAKAMAPKTQRYQTALEFSEDLGRVLRGDPSLARPATLLERSVNWAIRHQRTALVAAFILALTLIGSLVSLSLIAAQKRQTEVIARRNANNERIAREAVDRLGAQMAERLADIPAANGVRRQLLEETLSYYQQYALHVQNSPDLHRSLAMTLGKIGGLHEELGNTEAAVDSMRDSEAAFQQLAFENKADSGSQLEWATSLNNLGQSLRRLGRWEESRELIEQAIQTQQALAIANDNVDVSLQLATSYSNLGLLFADQGSMLQAEEAYQESIRLTEQLSDPNREISLHQAKVQTNLSGLLYRSRPKDAIELAQRALTLEASALEQQPNNAKLSKQTSQTLVTLASALAESKQYEAAVDSCRQAVEISQQLFQRWPEQPQHRIDLATNLNQLGVNYARLNRVQEAHDAFKHAVDHQKELVSQFPNDAEIASTAGSLLNNVGFLCQQLQQQEEAIAAFEEAVKFQEEAVRRSPQVDRYKLNLKKHHNNLQSALGKNR